MRSPVLLTLAVPIAALLASCASTGSFDLISLDEEWRLGERMSSDLASRLRLLDDRQALDYVNRQGQRIVAGTPMADRRWAFHIVVDPEVNAFSIPGGHVYVNTGLIAAAPEVSEFAAVLAHEIGHGVARHATKQLSQAYGLQLLAGLVLGKDPATYARILAEVVNTGAMARFSRADEREADDLGLRFMTAAGYDPGGMVRMFEILLSHEQRQPGTVARLFASHPLTAERVGNVRKQIRSLPVPHNAIVQDPAYRALRQRLAP